jgi:hypothetical protein
MSRIEVTDGGAAVGVPPGRSRVSSRCLRGATPDPAFGLIWADGHLVRGDSIGKHADGYALQVPEAKAKFAARAGSGRNVRRGFRRLPSQTI